MKTVLATIGAAVLSIAFALGPAPAAAQGTAAPLGTIAESVPPADVQRAGTTTFEAIAKGAPVRLGDTLRTGAGGRLKVAFEDKSALILAENSRLELTRHVYDPATRRQDSLYKLYEGKVRAIIGQLFGAASEYRIQSPTGVAGVKGTDFEEHFASPCTTVLTHDGNVYARNVNPSVAGEVTVSSGKFTLICEGKGPTPPAEMTDAIKQESIAARAADTLHPEVQNEMGAGSEGKTQGLKIPDNEHVPPDYPSENEQPTDTGGLPPGPVPEPKSPKND